MKYLKIVSEHQKKEAGRNHISRTSGNDIWLKYRKTNLVRRLEQYIQVKKYSTSRIDIVQ